MDNLKTELCNIPNKFKLKDEKDIERLYSFHRKV